MIEGSPLLAPPPGVASHRLSVCRDDEISQPAWPSPPGSPLICTYTSQTQKIKGRMWAAWFLSACTAITIWQPTGLRTHPNQTQRYGLQIVGITRPSTKGVHRKCRQLGFCQPAWPSPLGSPLICTYSSLTRIKGRIWAVWFLSACMAIAA
eukprot:1142172-Pelagomonas_calceolata.AAC.2